MPVKVMVPLLVLQAVPVTVADAVEFTAMPIVTKIVFVHPLASIAVTVCVPKGTFKNSCVLLGMNTPKSKLNVQVLQLAPLTRGLVILPKPALQR